MLRKRGSKVHMAVDTPGHPLALHVTPATADDRAEVGRPAAAVREATGGGVDLACVDQGHTGARAEEAAAAHGIRPGAVELPGAKRGFVLLPGRRVVEGSFARAARRRRLVRDHERPPETVRGLHSVAFACLMLSRVALAHGP